MEKALKAAIIVETREPHPKYYEAETPVYRLTDSAEEILSRRRLQLDWIQAAWSLASAQIMRADFTTAGIRPSPLFS